MCLSVQGINLLNGSYVRLRNIAIRHIRGIAIYGGELFDSPFENVSVMYCGNADPNNYAPCVLFDNAGGHDATNACKFDSLHLEANHTGGIWNKCRHMVFNSLKVERDEGRTSLRVVWELSLTPQHIPLTVTTFRGFWD
jgi:hypothetical protein